MGTQYQPSSRHGEGTIQEIQAGNWSWEDTKIEGWVSWRASLAISLVSASFCAFLIPPLPVHLSAARGLINHMLYESVKMSGGKFSGSVWPSELCSTREVELGAAPLARI